MMAWQRASIFFELQEVPVTRGILKAGKLLVQENEKQLNLLAIPMKRRHAVNGQKSALGGRTIFRAISTLKSIGAHYVTGINLALIFVLKEYAADFIGIQETRYLLEKMESHYSELVKEVQRLLPLYRITEVLQRLVSENISIRNMRTILEALVEWGQKRKILCN